MCNNLSDKPYFEYRIKITSLRLPVKSSTNLALSILLVACQEIELPMAWNIGSVRIFHNPRTDLLRWYPEGTKPCLSGYPIPNPVIKTYQPSALELLVFRFFFSAFFFIHKRNSVIDVGILVVVSNFFRYIIYHSVDKCLNG